MAHAPACYRELAERSWAWVLAQVRANDEGLWLPEDPDQAEPGEYPYGMHSGIGGLAPRPVGDPADPGPEPRRAGARGRDRRDAGPPDPRGDRVRLLRRAGQHPRGPHRPRCPGRRRSRSPGCASWRHPTAGSRRGSGRRGACAEGRCNDARSAPPRVLLGALWALRYDVPGAAELADHAADLLLAEGEERDTGVYWPFVPLRFLLERRRADAELVARPGRHRRRRWPPPGSRSTDPTSSRRRTLGRRAPGHPGRHQRRRPAAAPPDPRPGGPRHLHLHLVPRPGRHVAAVRRARPRRGPRGRPAARRTTGSAPACTRSASRASPSAAIPGFWDNDGRCCGTAGVGDVVLNVWQRHGHDDDLAFAVTLADALVDRAIDDGDHAYWRFVEHRNEDPLLPPGAGLDAGRRRHRGVPLPPRPRPRAGPRRRAPSPAWTPGGPELSPDG